MSEETENLVLENLHHIRKELADLKEGQSDLIELEAEYLREQISQIEADIERIKTRLDLTDQRPAASIKNPINEGV